MAAAYAHEPLRVEVTETRDSTWVHLDGELDLDSAAVAEAAVAAAVARRQRLTIDLRRLDFMDSSGVALLVRTHRAARQHGTTLAVAVAAGPITRLLEVCGLDRELTLIADPGA